ncbi:MULTISPECIES: discoidin domain-containing protein [unclassified Crossiella]|uniref:discoidin domain-containing protein n=1 Tax=unclassified Crossiella TaxID=2620835 RepID=UPI0020005381|nr:MULTISPECIES: discoidin domain-containing protein [unclassified Crossiella]MCK2242523.1 discoidin domain-containing protein [Crossiella sp. S99.2]MCK2254447.1 discoidin domain-containing protein [Crossiella sp. S99.1]
MRVQRSLSRPVAFLATLCLVILGGPVVATAAPATDLAVRQPVAASSAEAAHTARALTDGDQGTYWQSAGAALPQWAQVDLGGASVIDQVKLKLPAGWAKRTQRLAVQGSRDGVGFDTLLTSRAHTFDPAAGNTVSIDLPATTTRYLRLEVSANSGDRAAQLAEVEVRRATPSTVDIAAAATFTASSQNQNYTAANAGDGNPGSYWESVNNAFPQWIQADLGASISVNRLVLKLPANWETRAQTLTVRGSENGDTFTELLAGRAHTFSPQAQNTVTITFNATTTRYLRLEITANTAWPAAQLAEFEIYGPTTGDTQAPTAPGGLAHTQPGVDQIRLTWTAATDNVGVTGYDIYANNTLRSSVAGNVLTYTDTQPVNATVTYHVRARDAAGNASPNSNTVTRTGSDAGTNLAQGKPITASSHVHTFVAGNANDNDVRTYWEGGAGYPNTLTVSLGANADLSSVVLKLDPSTAWGRRTQTLEVLGRDQSGGAFTSLAASAQHVFDPAAGNTVTIGARGRAADIQLRFTGNTGAPAGQVAEFQVLGVPAPNPNLTVTGSSWTPATPVETDPVRLSATVRNAGSAAAGATSVGFYLGDTKVGTAAVGALAAGASSTVTADLGPRDAGSYPVTAKVDEDNKVLEQNETDNSHTNASHLVVNPVSSSDLVAAAVSWTPNNPSPGAAVNFAVSIRNQGSIASAAGAHGITLNVLDANGTVVRTLTGTHNGVITPDSTTAPVNLGSWPSAAGRHSVRVVLADDANELPVKRANNTSTQALFVGRGANMPYDMYEAEDAVTGGGASVVGPNRTIGDLAGEASGRRAVTLNSTGSFVEFTTRAATNTLVTRFSIPDSAGGGGIDATLNVYVNGQPHQPLNLTSKYSWLYGAEASPGNSPGAGAPRHIYDEAHLKLSGTIPAGSKIRLQKDSGNSTNYAIDFINTEQVAPIANPDPAKYTVPTGFGHQDVQNALDKVRMDTTGNLVGVYLPAGDYQTSSKFQVYGKAVKVTGAGPWFTRFHAPSTQDNTDIGFRAEGTAGGSSFANFAYLGNYTSRIDGPGKVFDFSNVADIVIDNIWNEHMVCLYWGANTDRITIKNSRIRNMFADAINMTNGSTDNHVVNNDSRASGDDSFALFSAIDAGGADIKNNVYENLTSTLTWRAAGIAVYGGYDNVFRNIYVADTLVYSGITISSLDFGYPMNGFGPGPTKFENISIVRAGGHFWNGQTFPGIWVFSASKVFRNIRVSDVDIIDPTYSGIMFQTKYTGSSPENPITDTVFTNVSISGARKSGDAFDAKSGFALWANELPEPGQGPAVGSVTFTNLRLSGNHTDIRNTTSTFTINRN